MTEDKKYETERKLEQVLSDMKPLLNGRDMSRDYEHQGDLAYRPSELSSVPSYTDLMSP